MVSEMVDGWEGGRRQERERGGRARRGEEIDVPYAMRDSRV